MWSWGHLVDGAEMLEQSMVELPFQTPPLSCLVRTTSNQNFSKKIWIQHVDIHINGLEPSNYDFDKNFWWSFL